MNVMLEGEVDVSMLDWKQDSMADPGSEVEN
jgi:hypothetical protein